MSVAALTLDEWQIRFHETMAAVLRATEAIKRQFGIWGLFNGLWRSNHDLKALNGIMKAISELPDGNLTEAVLRSQIPQTRKLLTAIEELMDTGRRFGWTNRTLTAGAFESIALAGNT